MADNVTTEVGGRGSEPANEPAEHVEETVDEGSAQRRLVEADLLVRSGLATLDGQSLSVGLSNGSLDLKVALPLPPRPLHPSMFLQVSEGGPTEVALERWFGRAVSRIERALPGQVQLVQDAREARIQWIPTPDTADDANHRAISVAGLVAENFQFLLNDGAESAARQLSVRLTDVQGRAERLSATLLDHALIKLPSAGIFHLLEQVGPENEDPICIALQRDADLLAPGVGKGLYIALRFPSTVAEERDLLGEVLAVVASQRVELPFSVSDDYGLFGEWNDLRSAVILTPSEPSELAFDDYLLAVRDLVRFFRSYVDFVWQGHDPFVLLATTPAREVEARRQHEEADEEAEAGWAAELKAKSGQQRPQAPAKKKKVKVPEIDRLSAREVVKRIQASQPGKKYDVFMSHPGYNIDKTVRIMSIVLSISSDEARALCEAAPVELAKEVPASRAQQLKQVLGGTGAKVRVVAEDEEDEQ